MRVHWAHAGNFCVGLSISRQTTLPWLVAIFFGWRVLTLHIGTPVYDIRDKRGWE